MGTRTRSRASVASDFSAMVPGAPGFDVAADRFQKQTLAIHRDLQLMRMFEAANTIQVGAKQLHAEFVFPAEWKVVIGPQTADRAQRHSCRDRCSGTDRRARCRFAILRASMRSPTASALTRSAAVR